VGVVRHKHIGELAVIARKRRGLTQKQLAAEIGTRQSAISDLETGLVPPVITTFLRVMDALEFDVEVTVRPRENWEASGRLVAL
jgi:transcriptional regulator with XRE-family HTH domain